MIKNKRAGSLRVQLYQVKQYYTKNGISWEIPFFIFLMSQLYFTEA
ncbi:MAG: hypothetical protein IJ039_04630 [Clostridia bacterium]|nr:hypothetical protein [Clostridia bacterium]